VKSFKAISQRSDHDEYVFCHNDFQQHVIVDPDTLKINSIIDWEYGGFYPAHFEWPFYTQTRPFCCWERRS
jgi:thiamine kinase-like enzyme